VLGMGGAQHATNTAPMIGEGGVDEVKELGRCAGTDVSTPASDK